jgi:2-iminobutanoate/2-iminopropanoate deaminase
MMEKTFMNPPDLPNWEQSFSQVVVVNSGETKTIYLSGQVSVNQENHIVGTESLEAQAKQAFQNLEKALAAAGATTADVVKLTIYMKRYQPADAAIVSTAFRSIFPQPQLPASTWLGVQALALEELLIEVDAIAVVESSTSIKQAN